MKIMICTVPIGPMPNDFPPFASLSIIQALRAAGWSPAFFDIDAFRPSVDQIAERLQVEAPDILGISAVVSTAYGHAKALCKIARELLPNVRIVVGGNLAASAEVLHRFCGVDVCVIGEGERVIVNLLDYYRRVHFRENYDELRKIKGITFLVPDGEMVFTGYEAAIPADELFDPDYSILEQHSNIGLYINDPLSRPDFSADPRTYEAIRTGKKMATVLSTKGCVARCTFCHRWDKGFRQLSPEKVIARIRYLMDRYNVGFIQIGDENFGSDRKATDELVRLIKPLNVLWKVSGMRAGTMELERLKQMRDAGCVAVYYGFESGSEEILQVMEKKLKLGDNYNAARWTHEAGLFTVYQLVLGMPGENHRTISDTIEMVKQITEFLPEPPYKRLSVNYIQALPGTPVYEYARATGLIGPRLEDEEEYLLAVSDTGAGDDTKFLNFTLCPYMAVQSWRPRLLYEATAHWYRGGNRWIGSTIRAAQAIQEKSSDWGEYFNLHEVIYHPWLLRALFPMRTLAIWGWTLVSVFRRSTSKVFFRRACELLCWPLREHRGREAAYRSLRHVMRDVAPLPQTESQKSMMPLRLGR